MRPFRSLVPLAALAILAGAEEAPLPPAVAREMDNHTARMGKIDQEADKARSDERTRMSKVLDDALKAETKKGNLETALRIKQLRDGLQPRPEAVAPAKPGAAAQQTLIVGTWSMANGQTWVIKPGGVFVRLHAEDGPESVGSWRSEVGRIVLVYANGRECPLVRVDATTLVVLRDGSVELGGQRVER